MTKTSKPKNLDQRLSRIEKSISTLATTVTTATKDLTILIHNQTNAVVTHITHQMNNKFADFSVETDKKMDKRFGNFSLEIDTKLEQLRENINDDINKSVMPLVYDHDERIEVLEKSVGIKRKN